MERLYASAFFQVRKMAQRAINEVTKGGELVESLGEKTIETPKFREQELVKRMNELIAKYPTGEDKNLTNDDQPESDVMLDLRAGVTVDLRGQNTPEQETVLQSSVNSYPAGFDQE